VETVTLQIPLPDRVVHDTSAYVRPLVSALDEGRPAGVLVVSSQRTRLLRWSLGEAEQIGEEEFELIDDVVTQKKSGPSPGNPANPHHGFVDRDRFDDRVDENRHRFFRVAAEDVLRRAKEEEWDRIVLSAPPKTQQVVRSVLEVNGGPKVVVADAAWEDSTPHHIAARTWDVLRTTRREREQALVDEVLERALGGGAGALGVPAVCAALNEGRVARLLYDADLTLEGFVGEDGSLFAAGAGLEDVHADRLFVERLLEKSILTSAAVTPLAPDTAAPLGPYDRVAALLRW
jgi:protein required for attachment to host cells